MINWSEFEAKARAEPGPEGALLTAGILGWRVRDDHELSDSQREAKGLEMLRLIDVAVAGGSTNAITLTKLFASELAWLRMGAPGDAPKAPKEGNC